MQDDAVNVLFQAPDLATVKARSSARDESTGSREGRSGKNDRSEHNESSQSDAGQSNNQQSGNQQDRASSEEDSQGWDSSSDEDQDGDGSGRRSRRKRRRGGRNKNRGSEGSSDSGDSGSSDAGRGQDPTGQRDSESKDDSKGSASKNADSSASGEQGRAATGENSAEDDSPVIRKRRRRRRGSSDLEVESNEDDAHTVTRVRAPREAAEAPASDKVTGLKGSTRLEAKRQRRRSSRDTGRRRQVITEAEFLARRESVDRKMIVRQRGERIQIGVLEDGVLAEHYVSHTTQDSLIGNVYLGKVQNVLPSMEAAFVDIGRGRNAVLYAGEVDWAASRLNGGPGRSRTP